MRPWLQSLLVFFRGSNYPQPFIKLEISGEDIVLQVNGLIYGDVYHVCGDGDVSAGSILIDYACLGGAAFLRTLMITT